MPASVHRTLADGMTILGLPGRQVAPLFAPLAQSVERRTVNPQVVGSSPTGGAKKDTTRLGGVFFGIH